MTISRRWKIEVKLADKPQYKLAQMAGIDPNTLSRLLHGIDKPRLNDPRVIAVGRVLGLQPEECFSDE